ncbi:hypothetical protein [Methylocella sp.]|jgi:DNA-binding Lrp family transcriptional regulator|uniref:hypothetical protein n=1 Tax=Methylocella sp. TaxID=1978226 RepID=UPI003C17B64B
MSQEKRLDELLAAFGRAGTHDDLRKALPAASWVKSASEEIKKEVNEAYARRRAAIFTAENANLTGMVAAANSSLARAHAAHAEAVAIGGRDRAAHAGALAASRREISELNTKFNAYVIAADEKAARSRKEVLELDAIVIAQQRAAAVERAKKPAETDEQIRARFQTEDEVAARTRRAKHIADNARVIAMFPAETAERSVAHLRNAAVHATNDVIDAMSIFAAKVIAATKAIDAVGDEWTEAYEAMFVDRAGGDSDWIVCSRFIYARMGRSTALEAEREAIVEWETEAKAKVAMDLAAAEREDREIDASIAESIRQLAAAGDDTDADHVAEKVGLSAEEILRRTDRMAARGRLKYATANLQARAIARAVERGDAVVAPTPPKPKKMTPQGYLAALEAAYSKASTSEECGALFEGARPWLKKQPASINKPATAAYVNCKNRIDELAARAAQAEADAADEARLRAALAGAECPF